MRTTDTKERLIKAALDLFSENTLVFKRMMDEGTMVRCNPEIAALEFIAPVSLLIQLCDRAPDKEDEVMTTIEEHIDIFIERWINT